MLSEEDLMAIVYLDFDPLRGPVVKWKREFNRNNDWNADYMDQLLINLYVMFNGGNGNTKPMAVLYENFEVVAYRVDTHKLILLFVRASHRFKFQEYAKLAELILTHLNLGSISQKSPTIAEDQITGIPIELVAGDVKGIPYSVIEGLVEHSINSAEKYVEAYEKDILPVGQIRGLGEKRSRKLYLGCKKLLVD